ncbi:MAG: hypothetical protein ABID04_01185 [Patescibacteria group bacterium]
MAKSWTNVKRHPDPPTGGEGSSVSVNITATVSLLQGVPADWRKVPGWWREKETGKTP